MGRGTAPDGVFILTTLVELLAKQEGVCITYSITDSNGTVHRRQTGRSGTHQINGLRT